MLVYLGSHRTRVIKRMRRVRKIRGKKVKPCGFDRFFSANSTSYLARYSSSAPTLLIYWAFLNKNQPTKNGNSMIGPANP